MLKINCEEFHTCDTCQSYRYDAYERHEYDEEGYNPKYGHLAFIYDRYTHYDDSDWGTDMYQPLENIAIEMIDKNREDELTLVFSGVCPKCHKKFYWTKYYNGDYMADDAPSNFIKDNI